jgi:hypothetical protein
VRLPPRITLKEARDLLYRTVVLRAYKDANHNRAAAARALGMSYKGFLNHLHKAQGKKKSPVPPAIRRIYAVSLARAREVRAAKAAQRRAGAGAAVKGKGAARPPPPTPSGLQHALPLPRRTARRPP